MQIVNLSTVAILHIAEAASRADAEGKRFRLSFTPEYSYATGGEYHTKPASVSYKVGEGTWSAPFFDQPDPFRDK